MAYYCGKTCQVEDRYRHKIDCDNAAIRRGCSGCGKEADTENMEQCSNCLLAWYCTKECRDQHRTGHNKQCQQEAAETVSLAESIRNLTQMLTNYPGAPFTYYWGNSPAVDLLQIQQNEGIEYNEELFVLLLGVGDPRNVALTVANLPDDFLSAVTFVLNDICACTLARTVLLLYMLYKGNIYFNNCS